MIKRPYRRLQGPDDAERKGAGIELIVVGMIALVIAIWAFLVADE